MQEDQGIGQNRVILEEQKNTEATNCNPQQSSPTMFDRRREPINFLNTQEDDSARDQVSQPQRDMNRNSPVKGVYLDLKTTLMLAQERLKQIQKEHKDSNDEYLQAWQ